MPKGGKRAVVLVNLGSPDKPETTAVRKYLIEFLSDPEVITLPKGMRWFTPILARIIAFFRSSKSAANYRAIWTETGSPLISITLDQVKALQDRLGNDTRVTAAMRYGNPSIQQVLKNLLDQEIDEILIIPMYPQYAGPTTKTALAKVYSELSKVGTGWKVHVLSSWHDHPAYLDAQADCINQYIQQYQVSPESSFLLFSAHSLPLSYIQAGDPYEKEMNTSIQEITKRLNWPGDRIRTAYQSRLGPVEWLGPSTSSVLNDLGEQGIRNILVCPISFTADCIETIHEIGIEYQHEFSEKHGGTICLIPAMNQSPKFIDCLETLTRENFSTSSHNPGRDS